MQEDNKAHKVVQMFEYLVKNAIREDYALPATPAVVHDFRRGLMRMKVMFGIDLMSDERIINFFTYQVYRFRDLIENPSANWSVIWCVSDNACEKYRRQFIDSEGKSGMRYFIDQWLTDNGVSKERLMAIIAPPKKNSMRQFVYMPSEEPVKMRFHNTSNGLLLCLGSTTGWSPKSAACGSCINVDKCKKETSLRYPELYRIRFESIK